MRNGVRQCLTERLLARRWPSAVVVVIHATSRAKSLLHSSPLFPTPRIAPPLAAAAGRRTVRGIASTRLYSHRKTRVPFHVATPARIILLSVLDQTPVGSPCAGTAHAIRGTGRMCRGGAFLKTAEVVKAIATHSHPSHSRAPFWGVRQHSVAEPGQYLIPVPVPAGRSARARRLYAVRLGVVGPPWAVPERGR
jgi:hypothetical protein